MLVAMLAILATSCKKDTSSTSTMDTQTALAQKVAFLQGVYSKAFNMVYQASSDSTIMNTGMGQLNGATVIYNSTTHTFTFTFGSTKSGNTTTGSYVATVTGGNIKDSAAYCHINFTGYTQNGYTIIGANDIRNLGGTSIKTFSDTVSSTKCIKGNDTTTFAATYSIVWDNGTATPTFADDEFTFSGNFNTSSNNGSSVVGTIPVANKLRITTQCQYIVYGILNMTMNSLDSNNQNVTNNVIVDFITSDGCNAQVSVTVDNTQFSFPLN